MKIKLLFIALSLLAITLGSCKKSSPANNNVPVGTATVNFQGVTYTYDSLNTSLLNQSVGNSYQTYIPISNSSATADFAIYGQIANGSNTINSSGLAGYGTTAGQVGINLTFAANGSSMSTVYYGNSGTVQLNGSIVTINATMENINTGAKSALTATFNF